MLDAVRLPFRDLFGSLAHNVCEGGGVRYEPEGARDHIVQRCQGLRSFAAL